MTDISLWPLWCFWSCFLIYFCNIYGMVFFSLPIFKGKLPLKNDLRVRGQMTVNIHNPFKRLFIYDLLLWVGCQIHSLFGDFLLSRSLKIIQVFSLHIYHKEVTLLHVGKLVGYRTDKRPTTTNHMPITDPMRWLISAHYRSPPQWWGQARDAQYLWQLLLFCVGELHISFYLTCIASKIWWW